jgi:hypothetical protein
VGTAFEMMIDAIHRVEFVPAERFEEIAAQEMSVKCSELKLHGQGLLEARTFASPPNFGGVSAHNQHIKFVEAMVSFILWGCIKYESERVYLGPLPLFPPVLKTPGFNGIVSSASPLWSILLCLLLHLASVATVYKLTRWSTAC